MSVREYIGARYVPLFADPIEWDNTKTYEPLTIVYYQGNSYTSRQAVPTGIAITNEDYWALTGNYNAQIEAYREEVAEYAEEVIAFDSRIDSIEDILPIASFDTTNTVDARLDAIETKFPLTSTDIANNAVTRSKIANRSITAEKIKKRVILIGDSWGQGWTPDGNVESWITKITNWLNAQNISVNSSAYGGTGLVAGTKNYLQLLTEIVTELTTDEKNEVVTVICAGGYNDVSQSVESTYNNAASALKTYVNNNLPNANLLIAFIGSCDYSVNAVRNNSINMRLTANYTNNACRYNNISCTSAENLLDGLTNIWASDGYHPNELGQAVISQYIKSIICGYNYSYLTATASVNIQKVGDSISDPGNGKITMEPFKLIPEAYNYGDIYLMGTTKITATNFTFDGNHTLPFAVATVEGANIFKNSAINKDITAVCRVDSKYYAISGLLHQINDTTNGIHFVWYPLCTNDSHTNYLSGSLDQIEFL